MDDWALLQEFATRQDEAAFRTLVARHGAMVHSIALRHLNEPHLAEDVAQAVFILLARKADRLRQGTVLSGWLFQTARFVAQRAVRCEQRRQRREQEALAMQQQVMPDAAWERIAPAVDDALCELNRADRNALLLRFFEGRSLREVGESTGTTEEAAKKRVARALEKLRSIVARRGLTLSVAALGASMAQQANATVAADFVGAWGSAALNSPSAPSLAVKLADEVMAAWRWAKVKLAASISATVVVVVVLIGVSSDREPRPPSAMAPATMRDTQQLALQLNAETIPEAGNAGSVNSAFKTLRFRAVAADTGEGITNARLSVNLVVGRNWEQRYDLTTDAAGRCDVPYPHETGRLDIGVFRDGWAVRSVTWPAEGHRGIADEYTLQLDRVTNAIGGWILDPQGRPLPNAEICFPSGLGDSSHRERPREWFGLLHPPPVTHTDAQGHWSIGFIPGRHPGFHLKARHPDFAETLIVGSSAQESLDEIEDEDLKRLWAGTLVTTIKPAFSLTGFVVDERNAPIASAHIQQREQSEIFMTDEAGAFRVPRLPEGTWTFTASAEGFAPVRTNALIGAEMKPVVVTLHNGAVLRLHLVDDYGASVPGATVGLEQWGEHRSAIEWRTTTDEGGHIEWNSAPRDAELELYASKDGYCWTRDVRFKADGQEHTIILRRALEVYGRVVDAETGDGIRDFRALPGYGNSRTYSDSELRWFGGETIRGTNGLFKLTFVENRRPWQVRIVADGYEDWISGPLTNEISVALDIALKRSAPEECVHGVVLKPDGTPAVRAQVALLSLEHNVRLLSRRVFEGNKRWVVLADENGTFGFTVNRLAHSVAAVSNDGYVHTRVRDPQDTLLLQLQPWGRVEGIVDTSARTHPVESIQLYDPAADNYQGRVSLLGAYSAKMDVDGRFVFESVPPGEFCVFVNSLGGIPYHHKTPLVVKPDEATEVTIIEQNGALVKGRFGAPVGRNIDWTKDRILAHLEMESPRLPISSADEGTLTAVNFWTSPAGRQRINTLRMISLRVYDDGAFAAVERVPAGKYRFRAVFKNASVHRDVVVSAEDEQLPHVDLGGVELR